MEACADGQPCTEQEGCMATHNPKTHHWDFEIGSHVAWPQTDCVIEVGLKSLLFLPPFPGSWGYGHIRHTHSPLHN